MKKKRKIYQLHTNVHKACSNDPLREWMTHVTFWDGYAYATDAHVLIKQSLTEIGFKEKDLPMLHGRMMSPGKMAALLKAEVVVVNEHGILDYDNGIQYNWSRQVIEFHVSPPFLTILANASKDAADIEGAIGFNPGVMKQAMSLFPSHGALRLQFYGRNRGVVITPECQDTDITVIAMPAMLMDYLKG